MSVQLKRITGKKKWFMLFILITGCFYSQAQNPVLLECVKMNKAYLAADHLSFNTRYTYAYENSPTVLRDSSHGVFKINGYKYWGIIDSIEMMQNDSFMIVAYKPDKVLSIALPSFNYVKQLPMTHWDSLFLKTDQYTYTIGPDSGYKKITVEYAENAFKSVQIWYDSTTYMIHRMKWLMDDATSDQDRFDVDAPLSGTNVLIDIFFTSYATGLFTDVVFNSGNYFSKAGTVYTAEGSYSDYEVFLSSAGL